MTTLRTGVPSLIPMLSRATAPATPLDPAHPVARPATRPTQLGAKGFALQMGPVRGESLDSYVHSIARHLHASPLAITEHLGLGLPTSAGYLNRDLPVDDLLIAADTLGVAPDELRDLTLHRWDWLALRPDRGKRGSPVGAWQRGSGARYCWRCLRDSDGRWKLSWYLHWAFACTEHATLLTSTCGRCGRAPRNQKPTTDRSTPARALELGCGCGAVVSPAASTDILAVGDPRLRAQDRIDTLLSSAPTHEAGMLTAGQPVTPQEWLTDLTLTNHLIMLSLRLGEGADAFTASTASFDLQDVPAPTHWATRWKTRLNQPDSGAMPTPQILQRLLVTSAADVAACVTLATALLDSDDVDHLRSGLVWVPNTWRVQMQQRAARDQFRASDSFMEALAGHVRKTTETWYTSLRAKHRPRPSFGDDYLKHFPTSIHPGAQSLLNVIWGELKEAAVVVGLLSGRRDPRLVRDTARDLGLAHLASEIATVWMQLSSTPSARTEIKYAAAWLFNSAYQAKPVDFAARREHLPDPRPLPARVTRGLATFLGARNSPTLRLMAELYVWERVTGSNALLTPSCLTTYGAFRVRYRRLRNRWNQCLPPPLRQHLSGIPWLDGTRSTSTIASHEGEVEVQGHWTTASHTKPHLVPTPLIGRRDLTATHLRGADAITLAQVIAGEPEAEAWAGIRLMWRYNQTLDSAPPVWLARARHDVRRLIGDQPQPSAAAQNTDTILHTTLVTLRSRQVPHVCPYFGDTSLEGAQ